MVSAFVSGWLFGRAAVTAGLGRAMAAGVDSESLFSSGLRDAILLGPALGDLRDSQ